MQNLVDLTFLTPFKKLPAIQYTVLVHVLCVISTCTCALVEKGTAFFPVLVCRRLIVDSIPTI